MFCPLPAFLLMAYGCCGSPRGAPAGGLPRGWQRLAATAQN
jgi:hypothetical protein